MPRISVVKPEAVWAAAEAIRARGEPVRSASQVRLEMKKALPPGAEVGAQGKIHEFFLQWRDQPAADVGAPESALSPALLNVLRVELKAGEQRVRSELEAETDALLTDAQDLADRNVALEADVQRLNGEVVARTTERDAAIGALDECRLNLDRALAAVQHANELQEKASAALAVAEADRVTLRGNCTALEQVQHQAAERIRSLTEQLQACAEGAKSAAQRAASAEAYAGLLQSQASRRPVVGLPWRAAAVQSATKFKVESPARRPRKV